MQRANYWPELDYQNWKQTRETLHRWTQVIGKVRLRKSPWTNHSWHSTFYVTEKGLSTSLIHDVEHSFSVEFDLVRHILIVRRSDGNARELSLESQSVSDFYQGCIRAIGDLDIPCEISTRPNELVDDLAFPDDQIHRVYDPSSANRFFRVLLESDRIMKIFRSHFIGKVSPVHFFWGSFDLAVTRFSGRRAPEHPGGIPHLPDLVTRDAYSHEVSSCGFWPGNERFPFAAYYAYAYPVPAGFDASRVPKGAYWESGMREFFLPYEVVRSSSDPERLLLEFFQATYDATATLARWDRKGLEESPYLFELQARGA